jgi:hypothetical protein
MQMHCPKCDFAGFSVALPQAVFPYTPGKGVPLGVNCSSPARSFESAGTDLLQSGLLTCTTPGAGTLKISTELSWRR